jgi:hypothetical protein
MSVELEEFEPGRWRVKRPELRPKRSDNLPLPYVISDIMEPTEQVDGKFYTSKRQFRAVGRSLGLIEVGNEKFKPKSRATDLKETKISRRQSLKVAIEKYKAGHRPSQRFT